MRVWDDGRPNASRFRRSIGLALLLHLVFWFAPTSERSARAFGATPGAELDSLQISLEAHAPERTLPGGGSPAPEPKASPSPAPKPPPRAAPKPVAVVRSAPPKSAPPEPEPAETEETSPFDLLAALDTPSPTLTKAGPRKVLLASHATPAAPVVGSATATATPHAGSGPGAHGGPGGPGAGAGNGSVVKRQFAFGGPTGAFRAEVCAIRRGTKSLREIKRCPLLATFFTNTLDVAPRAFNEGFPGVTTRTEWFAIRYRGKFTVKAGDYYRFRLVSDDGALLYIDGYLVIDNDGQHPPATRHATIQLEAGEHELFVDYYQGPRENLALQLFVKGSNGPERLLGPSF